MARVIAAARACGQRAADYDLLRSGLSESLGLVDPQSELLLMDTPSPAASSSSSRTNRKPIRIRINATLLDDGADPRACYRSGQRVVVGRSSSTSSAKTECPLASGGGIAGPIATPCLYTCTSDDVVDSSVATLIGDGVMGSVAAVFEETLLVDRVEGGLLLNRDVWKALGGVCEADVPVPPEIVSGSSASSAGVPDADIIVFVTARPPTDSKIIAGATPCNFNWDRSRSDCCFGRPLAAYINFNPKYMRELAIATRAKSNSSRIDFGLAVKVGLHEMTHALGFAPFFFSSFPHSQSVRSRTLSGKTPDMVGEINPFMRVSELSFALLEDTGFYDINKEHLEPWLYGKSLGCKMLDTSCTKWPSPYFCKSDGGQRTCTTNLMGIGKCRVITYEDDLALQFQHLKNTKQGGDSTLADYCPQVSARHVTALDEFEICTDASSSASRSSVGAQHCPECRCIDAQGGPACLQTNCTADGRLVVVVKGAEVVCPDGGGSTGVGGLRITCPAAAAICPGGGGYTVEQGPASTNQPSLATLILSVLVAL
eukprot:m51a1_g2999 hypothetical protein (542) ;mRNA; f:769502-771693